MKVIIDLPLHSMVLEANPVLLNALTQAMVVSQHYEHGMRYEVEEKEQLSMHFIDDSEFEQALIEKKEMVNNG